MCMSSCPRCSASASLSRAMSGRSLITSFVCDPLVMDFRSLATASSSRSGSSFCRSWSMPIFWRTQISAIWE